MLHSFGAILYYQPLGAGSKLVRGTETRYGWAGPIEEEVGMTYAGRHWHFAEADDSCFGWRVVTELEVEDNTAEMELEYRRSVGEAVDMTAGLHIFHVTRSFLERIE